MENISDRLTELINHEGISARSLEHRIGCSNGVLSKCMARGTDISSLWLSKIIIALPHFSSEWLLTGKGDMIRPPVPSIPGMAAGTCEVCKIKDKLIDNQDKQIKTLEKLVDQLEKNSAFGPSPRIA